MLLYMYMYVDSELLNVFLLIIDFIMYINTAVNENVNGYFEYFFACLLLQKSMMKCHFLFV